MTDKVQVYIVDYWDKERTQLVKMKLSPDKVIKGATIKKDDVTYKVTKVFTNKKYDRKCVEIRMVAYKIDNTVTKFPHNCPAKKGQMERMSQEHKEQLVQKYGEKTVEAWNKGKVKMNTAELATVCPECECVFWKEKNELPESVEVISLKGKKKLKKRK